MTHIKDYTGRRAHLIGIGGSSMSGLAGMLVKLGVRVTGSDSARSYTTDALEQSGIHVFIGQRAENVDGADIVITGRVADPALAVGPLMYEFGKDYDADVDFLGKATVAGHLLECGAQVTGGYFADPGVKDVPELWNLGFPILTFTEDERILLEKLPQAGGRLDRQTVTEQLLYEIQDPANYFTPDVIADFSQLSVEELSDGRVEVKGAAGKKRTGTLKVSVGYQDGYIGEGQISYGGRNCVARAKLAAEVIQKRLVLLNKHYSETRTDLIGVNSLYGAEQEKVFPAPQLSEVRLRVAVRAEKKEDAEVIGREIEALYVNGPAGGGGVRSSVESVLSIASVLIPEEDVHPTVCWERGE